MHNDFTVFQRVYPNGKKVFFYYTYDEEGERRGPWTTKCRCRTAAVNYCHKLLKAGKLMPNRRAVLTFGDFARGFWERGSRYLENQEGRADITESYIVSSRGRVKNQILPFFGDVPLEKITEEAVNNWLLGFKKRERTKNGKPTGKLLSSGYANTVFGTFAVMMGEAAKQKLIPVNPCANVELLKKTKKKIEILTLREVQDLFPEDYRKVWGDRELLYAANRLASLTGMRAGEIMGLRGEYVFDNYIYVCGQYTRYGYGTTKTKESRYIPLIPEMMALLHSLKERNGNGFVFSGNGGEKPISHNYMYSGFQNALVKIGIDRAEIRRRGLSIHGWRHFVNTELQRQGMTIQQIQSITGHKSERMTTDVYNHLDARYLSAITDAQKLIAGDLPVNTENKSARSQIVNFPQNENFERSAAS